MARISFFDSKLRLLSSAKELYPFAPIGARNVFFTFAPGLQASQRLEKTSSLVQKWEAFSLVISTAVATECSRHA